MGACYFSRSLWQDMQSHYSSCRVFRHWLPHHAGRFLQPSDVSLRAWFVERTGELDPTGIDDVAIDVAMRAVNVLRGGSMSSAKVFMDSRLKEVCRTAARKRVCRRPSATKVGFFTLLRLGAAVALCRLDGEYPFGGRENTPLSHSAPFCRLGSATGPRRG